MPTSSQALILKVTDGHLPPIFGRRYWRPTNSHLYPITNIYAPERRSIQSRERFDHALHTGYDSYDRTDQVSKARLSRDIRHDHTTLEEVLRIRGLKGSLGYDSGSSTYIYEVDSLPKTRVNNWILAPENVTLHRHASENQTGNEQDHVTHAPSNSTGSHVTQNWKQRTVCDHTQHCISNSVSSVDFRHRNKRPNLRCQHKFVKMGASGELLQVTQSEQGPGDFFKLVKVLETDTAEIPSEQNEKNELGEQNCFRLIKVSSTENGAFRLAKADQNEAGEVYLVPPDGCESDDFRLVPSERPGCYSILQAVPWVPGAFKELKYASVHGDEFRLVSATTIDTHISVPGTYPSMGVTEGVNAISPGRNSTQTRYQQSGDYMNLHESSVRYKNLTEILEDTILSDTETGAQSKELSLPDITLSGTKHRMYNLDQSQLEVDKYDFNAEEFAAKYMDGLRENSTEVYERLVNLGFRRSRDDAEHPRYTVKTGDNVIANDKLRSCDWRTYNFDKWTRTTEASQPNHSQMSLENNRFIQPGRVPRTEDTHRASLLEELKKNANYKLWKKKKAAGIRMRKELPPEDSKAVCLSLKDNAIAHDVLLEQVKKETRNQLTGLQFDPLSVHSQESDVKSQWILRFTDEAVCDHLLEYGINILGTTYQVRRFNDVMKDEHEAYKFSVLMQKIKEHKLKEQNAQKSKPSKRLKTSQTQTPRGTL